ncbi:ABC transporter ATP-binding protein [Candidatus Sumerlaeota bacterium]|nr:ABC transporter ATP-binding protein [Candidatus Sumerlaeota bacterium]
MTDTTQPVIEACELVVEYGKGAQARRAVDGVSFAVQAGECVGFIGANGAGKSTTLKTLMGFIFAQSGGARIFGLPPGAVESRRRIGYLPEVALYYPFMKARELLELYGGLHGMTRAQLREKIPPMLERVGLGERGEELLKSYSKGMQQRLGIAQALIADPEALIFDELSSGLDPIGRHDLRRVLLELKSKGRTIFFSSHELTEVEALCDRVIMIHQGRIVTQKPVAELLKPLNLFEIRFADINGELPTEVKEFNPARQGSEWTLRLDDLERYTRALDALRRSGCEVRGARSLTQSLEDYFISLVEEARS